MFLLIAQQINNPALGTLGALNGVQFFSNLIPSLLSALVVIGVLMFTFYLIWGAIDWITSGGDKGRVEAAKGKVTNAVIGIVVLLSFFAILSLVECFFGIGLRQINIGPFNVSLSGSTMCGGTGGTGGTGTGPIGGQPGGPGNGTGLSACGCNTGGCATNGQVGLGNNGQCWVCSTSGWGNPSSGTCPAISCVSTCQ